MGTTANLNGTLRRRAFALLAILGVLCASGCATPTAAPQAPATHAASPDFRRLVELYGPAVVRVSVEGDSETAAEALEGGPPEGGEPIELAAPLPRRGGPPGSPARGTGPFRMTSTNTGSGFIVSADGYVLTASHMVEGGGVVTVRLPDQREFKARVIGADKRSDVAVLKIDAENLPTVRLGSARAMKAGDWVVAIGSPYGFENTATAGIVSATARVLPHEPLVPFLQNDVAVNPGNSGGPLFNLDGEVVGINSQIFSTTGSYHGISFAVPIELAVKVRDAILRDGRVVRGRLGFELQEVNQALAASFGLPKAAGALVIAVENDGPAAQAGLASGDIVVGVGGDDIKRSADLSAMIAEMKPGTTAALRIWSKGALRDVAATVVGDAEASGNATQVADEEPEPSTPRLSLALRSLTPAEEYLIDASGGLLVSGANGSAARAGIQPGDVILAVNGTPVRSAEELHGLFASATSPHVALLVQRGEGRVFVPVEKETRSRKSLSKEHT